MKTSIIVLFVLFSNTMLSQRITNKYEYNGNAKDVKGRCDGFVDGATLVADRNGNINSAYSFDGVNDYIKSKLTLPTVSQNGSFSIESYVYIEKNKGLYLGNTNESLEYFGGVLFGFYGFNKKDSKVIEDMFLVWHNNASLIVNFRNKSKKNVEQEYFITPIGDEFFNKYHHLVIVKDGKNGKLLLYIDGVLSNEQPLSSEYRFHTSVTYVGKDVPFQTVPKGQQTSVYLKGKIDYLRIRQGLLTAEQVTAIYNVANQNTSSIGNTFVDVEIGEIDSPEELSAKEFDYLAQGVQVYPNPSRGNINISASEKLNITQIQLMNNCGQVVYQSAFVNNFNLDNVRPGCYTLVLKTNKQNIVRRVMISR